MARVDAYVDGNRIVASLKYPDGLRKKWDETEAYTACGECGSESIISSVGDTWLVLACDECATWERAGINCICTYYQYSRGTQEARVETGNLAYFERTD